MRELIRRHPGLLCAYRFLDEAIDVRRLLSFPSGLVRYMGHLRSFRRARRGLGRAEFVLFPKLHDRTATTKTDPHYFYQGYWAFAHVHERRPSVHYDVGSQIDFVRYLSAVTKVVFIDIRPIGLRLPNLECVSGSILASGLPGNSVPSLSSLHVVEHIGLGRYGDPIDPRGSEKAATEMARILKPGGRLYISTPVGRPRICFDAHHIRTPRQVVELFGALVLEEFSVVNDEGNLVRDAGLGEYERADYACGLFVFSKPADSR